MATKTADEPNEGLCNVPLLLRGYTDYVTGTAALPLMSVSAEEAINADLREGQTPFSLTMNGQLAQSILSFSVIGEDYVRTGPYYWEFAAALGVVIALYLLLVYRK